MSIYCQKIGLLYLANPSTGSTSILDFLRRHHHGLPSNQKHETLAEIQSLRPRGFPRRFDQVLVCTGIRNPFDALTTHYCKHQYRQSHPNAPWHYDFSRLLAKIARTKPTFAQFCTPAYFQKFMERQWKFLQGIDEVLVHERGLQNELDRILAGLGCNNQQRLPQRNRIAGKDYRQFYDSKLRQRVERGLRPWLEYAGYDFDGFRAQHSQLLRDLKKGKL